MGEIRLDDMSNEYFDVLRELGNILLDFVSTSSSSPILMRMLITGMTSPLRLMTPFR